MRPKQPIPLSSIFEYYCSANALKRPKQQVINQLKDLSIICQFLQDRIPSVMKNLRQSAKSHQKGIKDLSSNIRSSLNMAIQDPKLGQCFSLQTAYDQFSHFSLNKLVENDYVEKTLAEKQMKLKFLQSQGLPEDFIWQKPVTKSRKQDYSWHSFFNTKYHMLEIPTRKYKILVTLAVANNTYIWAIDRIILKASQQYVLYMMKYFDQKIKPAIKAKYPLAYEENMLASINSYSHFLQLMDLNFNICLLANSQFFSERVTVKHQGKDYLFTFGKPEELDDASVYINQVDRPNIVVKLWFVKKQISCTLEIEEMVLGTPEQFKYENCRSLINLAEQLIQYSIRVINFYQNPTPPEPENSLFIKVSGMYWLCGVWLGKSSCSACDNGVYIGKFLHNNLVYASIQQDGSLLLPKINRVFLTKLIRQVETFDIFFSHVYVINKLLMENSQRETELQHYYLNDKDKQKKIVVLYFKKKACVEQQMMKTHCKTQITQQESFNVVKFTAEFNINFQQLTLYSFRDPEVKVVYEKEEWKPYLNTQNSGLLDIPKVIEIIQYLQENMIFQFVIQKKMKSDSKPLYSIKI